MSAEVRVSGRNVVNGAGEVIAKCTWERDAERIAAALNAAGVVEALQDSLEAMDALAARYPMRVTGLIADAQTKARAALAAVRGDS